MTKLIDGGWVLETPTNHVLLPTRALTPTEYGYKKGLSHCFGKTSYEYPHELFEIIDDDLNRLGLNVKGSDDSFSQELNLRLAGQSSRVASHTLQRAQPGAGTKWRDLDDTFVGNYVRGQLMSELDIVTIPERSPESSVESLEVDIGNCIDAIRSKDKLPRVLIDMASDNDEAFENKIEAALAAGIVSLDIRHRSLTGNYEKFVFLREFSKKSLWVHMSGVERLYRRKGIPASYPSLLSFFGIKSTSIRKYQNPGGDMDYTKLRLFDEASLGLLSRKEQTNRYPSDEFVSESGFSPFIDIRKMGQIYELCSEHELHQPVYSYETVASRFALQQSAVSLRRGTFVGKYCPQHELLNQAVEGFLV
jgi:hypothetical protein